MKYILITISILFLSCRNSESNRIDNIIRYNETSNITSLDPIYSNTQANIWATSQIFNTLVELDENAEIQPSLAKSWIISECGTTYKFFLRDDVFYHSSDCFGKDSTRKVSAYDFLFSISRINNEKMISPGRWVLDYISVGGVRALDDYTLEIELPKKFPGLLGLLSMPYFSFIPYEAVAFYRDNFSFNPIGTGPFKFKKWKKDQKLILVKNEKYFEYDEYNQKIPYVDGVSISFISQKESVFMNFILNKFDFISGLDNSFRDELILANGELKLEYKNRFQILSTPYLNTEYLGIHLPKVKDDNSPLMYKNFRKALNFCFSRDEMVKFLRNNIVSPAYSFVPNSLKTYSINNYNSISNDSIKKLLETVPNFDDIIILNTTSDYLDVCEFIQHSASKFGINIKIEVSSPAVHRDIFSSGKSSLFRASWIADYPDPENFLSLFYSKNKSPNGPNYTHYDSDEFDYLYEKSFFSSDSLSRNKLFKKMEIIINEESVVVPLYYDYTFRLLSSNISNMSINCMNKLCLKNVKKNTNDR